MRRAILLPALLLLAACRDEPPAPEPAPEPEAAAPVVEAAPPPPATVVGAPPPAAGEAVDYQCEDMRVTARFEGEQVKLEFPGAVMTLPAARAASGARYADGVNSFWTKGDGALFTWEKYERKCLRVGAEPKAAIAPSIDGPGISARGNEPGWTVQVSPGVSPRVVALLDYGQRRVEFEGAERFADADGGFGVRAGNGDGRFELTIREQRCQDSMSGQYFAANAELVVGEARYFGCATVASGAGPGEGGAADGATDGATDEAAAQEGG